MNKKEKAALVPKLRFSEFLDEWKSIPFEKIFAFQPTNTFSRNLMNTQKGKVRNIHYGDVLIKYGYVLSDISSIPFVNEDVELGKYSRDSYLRSGDVVIADTAEDLTAGKAVEVQNVNCDILSGLHTMLCRPINQAAPGFWGYYINSPAYHNTIIPLITGVKVSSISKSNIIKTFIASTNIAEQQKIADCLSSFDDLITAEDEKFEALKSHKKGLLQKLFPAEGKTVPEWRFPEFRDNGEWEENKLDNICEYKNGGSFEKYIVDNGKYNLITLNSIDIDGNLKNDHKQVNAADWYLCKNDLVIVLSDVAHGDFLGICDLIPEDNKYVLNQRMGLLRIDISYNVNFIRYFINLNQHYFKLHGQGSNQKNLSKDVILNLTIKIPKYEEQRKISDCLSELDKLITVQIAKIETLKSYKKGLMQGLFPSFEEVHK